MEGLSTKIDRILADTKDIKDIKSELSIIKNIQAKCEGYENKINAVENKISIIEAGDYSKNVILYNVEESEKNNKELLNLVQELIKKTEVNIQDICIADVKRIGVKNDDKVRPVVLKLIATRWKYLFFDREENFKKLGISISSDMPKEKRVLKSKLLKARYILRLQRKEPVLQNLNLILNERNLTIEEIEGIISESAENEENIEANITKESDNNKDNDTKISLEKNNEKTTKEVKAQKLGSLNKTGVSTRQTLQNKSTRTIKK